ncbi:unnamed protein product, partial [Bubo scandiacus]
PGHSLSRRGEEEMPRPLAKDTLRLSEPLRPPRGDAPPHSSPPLPRARPAAASGPPKHPFREL